RRRPEHARDRRWIELLRANRQEHRARPAHQAELQDESPRRRARRTARGDLNRAASPPVSSRVAVIGLDCAEPRLVFERWRQELPDLSQVIERGTWGALRGVGPPVTLPAVGLTVA